MEIYTIGFTKKSAAEFFRLLKKAGIKRLIDVRLNNSSQLAAFTKKDDLKFFLKEICQAAYIHLPSLAPTKEIIDDYKKKKGSWQEYEERFQALMKEKEIENTLDKSLFNGKTVLLCSEATADNCHRRLVAEYLKENWGNIEIIHL